MSRISVALFHAVALGVALWLGSGGGVRLALPGVLLGAASLLWARENRRNLDASAGAREGRGSRGVPIAGVLLVSALLAAVGAEAHLDRISSRWDAVAEAREREVRNRLSLALDALLEAGESGAARLVQHHQQRGSFEGETSSLPAGMRPAGVDALAIFGPAGELLAWDGHHQGPVPRAARLGLVPYLYNESALFGSLYVTRPLPEGVGTAVAASLLRADLPAALAGEQGDFVSRFERAGGGIIEIARPNRLDGESIWDFRWEGDVLFSVSRVPETEAEVRAEVFRRWQALVLLLVILAWGALARGARAMPGGGALAAGALLGLVAILPVRSLVGVPRLFSPADFLLPGPLPLSLGLLLFGGLAGIVALGVLRPVLPRRIPPEVFAGGGALLAPGLLMLLDQAASRDVLTASSALWVWIPTTATLLLTLMWSPVAFGSRSGGGSGSGGGGGGLGGGARPGIAQAWRWGAIVSALALGFAVAWSIRTGGTFSPRMAVIWGVPLLALARGASLAGRQNSGRTDGLARVALFVAAGTLSLAWGWGIRVEARVIEAEERVSRLGVRPDPFLEFLLFRLGEEVQGLGASGRDPVELLYGAWTGSGMAREGVPVWLTWWSAEGVPGEELRIGVSGARPSVPLSVRAELEAPLATQVRRLGLADVHYAVSVPVRGGWVTALLPPRRTISRESPLGPLFSPAQGEPDPLSLVPLGAGEGGDAEASPLRWISTPDGIRGEVFLVFPDQSYRGQLRLSLPGPVLLLARGAILLLIGGMGFLLLEGIGARLVSEDRVRFRSGRGGIVSFRARVTLALFGFFLIPTLLFGVLAFRTLTTTSLRTAETLAERSARDAGRWYADVGGALDLLATRVGSDLLLYDEGQLAAGSQRELVELGLYEGWLPPEVQRELSEGARVLTSAAASLGGWRFVVAYQRLPGGQVLAVPAPLEAGATAVRQREITDLVLFAVVLGGVFSFLLSRLVGRALSSPIQTLQVASERVGSGNMNVHLPEDRADEFGSVFGAFNRMVSGLSKTRRALVRSSRRTRAIVEEVATGVIAVDPQGRVTLANPRAEAFVGGGLPRGVPIGFDVESGRGVRRELAEWVGRFLEEDRNEGSTELVSGDRRLRIQARTIPGPKGVGGVVLALEDVTDELRTERILAWGEMAQQVAHEVKNPLTPMKLGVQHIRRAWEAGSPDFDGILSRNVDAILAEIDRLAGIATSFSRYAAPAPVGTDPLEPVDVDRVVAEVMALYGAGEGPVDFRAVVEPGLPSVVGRAREVQEVLVNLLENARAVLPEGGIVEIRAMRRQLGPDTGVEIQVVDSGPGIPSEFLPRMFEPHFSTRSSGTGLGLAIVRRLVESWGGGVWAENRAEGGMRVGVRMGAWADLSKTEPNPASRGGHSSPSS